MFVIIAYPPPIVKFEVLTFLYFYATINDVFGGVFMNAIAEQRLRIFNDAKSVLWEREKLKALAEKYGYSLKRFNDICRAYVENTLGFNRGEYGNFKRCYRHFVLFHLNTYEVYIYYDKFASSQEKEEFHQKVKAFFGKIIQEFKAPNFDKQIWLQENNLTDCDLYKVVSIFGNLEPAVVNVVYNTFKFYYDYADSVNFEKADIIAKANELGITYQYFISLINAYGWHILKMKDDFRMLALYIRSGITVNNETRDFDLIDFFMLFPNLNPLINFHLMDIDPLDKTNISLLLDPMKFASYINKTSIMKGFITIGSVTFKEKELGLIIRFLEDNNVPLYDRVFMIACKRYINNTLDVSYLQAELV